MTNLQELYYTIGQIFRCKSAGQKVDVEDLLETVEDLHENDSEILRVKIKELISYIDNV